MSLLEIEVVTCYSSLYGSSSALFTSAILDVYFTSHYVTAFASVIDSFLLLSIVVISGQKYVRKKNTRGLSWGKK